MRSLVIFGTGHLAALAGWFFERHGRHRVTAHTVEAAYLAQPEFQGRPVVPLEKIAQSHPPGECDFLVACGPHRCNELRQRIFETARTLGYDLPNFIHPQAFVAEGVELGQNVVVFPGCVIEPWAQIGDNVVLWSGCVVAHHGIVRSHSYLAPRVALSGCVEVGERCFLGTQATVRDHVRLAPRTLAGCGAVIRHDTEPDGVYAAPAPEKRPGVSTEVRL